ncbi:MAG: cellulose biosynthesis cyclic di-GMP-binding regulatory protein BcsB, partial [Rubritepida sp.]|nr:cellulose biosynthesis cyclic di-GMP-binding regulatory protein BcsB [Rubritepida sp.]
IGTLSRQPALNQLLRETPVRQEGERLTVALPDMLQEVRGALLDAPGRAERSRASATLGDAAGEGLAAFIGGESPLAAGRSVVALTGATPASIAALVAALRDPDLLPLIQGDVALLSGGRIAAFRASTPYTVGELPWWLWPQRWAGEKPVHAALILLAAGVLIGFPAFWALRRRALSRLRARG